MERALKNKLQTRYSKGFNTMKDIGFVKDIHFKFQQYILDHPPENIHSSKVSWFKMQNIYIFLGITPIANKPLEGAS